MSEIQFGKYLIGKIGETYKNYGYENLSQFENMSRNNDLKALKDLFEIGKVTNFTDKKLQPILMKLVELKDKNSMMRLASCYIRGDLGFEMDYDKASKVYEEVIEEFDDDEAKIELYGLKYIKANSDQEKERIISELERIGSKNGENALLVYYKFLYMEDYERAIRYLKLARVHRIINNVDQYDNVDEENVMYAYYSTLYDLYLKIDEEDKANEYLNKGYEHKIPDCMVLKAHEFQYFKKYEEALKVLNEVKSIDKNLGLYNLGYFYLEECNPYKNYALSIECFKEALDNGLTYARDGLNQAKHLYTKEKKNK